MSCCCVTSVYDHVATDFPNFNTIIFTPTGTAATITFRVRRTGQGNIRIYVRADADAAGERFEADVEIRRDNSAGAIVHSPSVQDGGIAWEWSATLGSNQNFYGERPFEPLALTPGIYWAQLQFNTQGTNVDIAEQWLRFGA